VAEALDRGAPGAGARPPSPADSLAPPTEPEDRLEASRRRLLIYLMLFRLVVTSLVLGSSLLLAWLSDADMSSPSARLLSGIIVGTYTLTIVYALLLDRVSRLERLAYAQLCVDLILATLLVHITGGAQSAYTFFYPLAIIGAATLRLRVGSAVVAAAAVALFVAVSLAGWLELLPRPAGDPMFPSPQTGLELARSLGLNVAAFAAVALLAYNLGHQLQRTSAVLESERSVTADLRTLHADIVRSLSSGLLTIDTQGTVLTLNAFAAEILRCEEGRAAGQPVDRIMPGLMALTADLGERSSLRRQELAVARDEGPDLVLGVSISPLFDHRDRVLGRVVNFQDLSELRRIQKRYEQAQRLAVVGELAAGIAHEIRNPLASISGSLELLRTGPDADPETQALTDIVVREIDRLNGLITDLLDYTNPQPRELAEIDLRSLAAETVEMFSRDKSLEGVKPRLDDRATQEPVQIIADAGKLQQVLWNLLRNAGEVATERVRVRVEKADEGGAVLTVEDDGPGISVDPIERIFEPFFTTKSRGSGLGLATVQSIVHAHGGLIRAFNRDPGGCTFVVYLPPDARDVDSAADGPVTSNLARLAT
jgi:two-component system, NtrC family, sensor histidine kinase PilS